MCRRIALLTLALAAPWAAAADPDLSGTWLPEAAAQGRQARIDMLWTAKLTIRGRSFALSKFCDAPMDWKGTLAFPAAGHIDVTADEYDLAPIGAPLKVPGGLRAGVYQLTGDRLTVCLAARPGDPRPARLDAVNGTVRLTFVRAPAGFADHPEQVTVRVVGPDGSPAAGAAVGGQMHLPQKRPGADGPEPDWQPSGAVTTAADGTAKVKYESLRFGPVVARDAKGKAMAAATPTPATLPAGPLTLTLAAERPVAVPYTCDELTKAGQPIGYVNAYLLLNDRRVAFAASKNGRLGFVAPPGDYVVELYGADVLRKRVPVAVPADASEVTVPAVELPAAALPGLKGKPAPEFVGVAGWKGDPVTLADLKGKHVLVEFWGYWCGPCIAHMPVLIELHERFADKGLAIVGVHLDGDGEVATAAQLDDKIAGFRKAAWGGKGLPFPVALASGKADAAGVRGPIAAAYGVTSYPTTVLIGPDGKVVGRFDACDAGSAAAAVERLLAGPKK